MSNPRQAAKVKAAIEATLDDLHLGRLHVPDGADIAKFVVSGGRVTETGTQSKTFPEAAAAWLETRKDRPATTYALERRHVRMLSEFFGQRPVSRITPQDIQAYIDQRSQLVIGCTIQGELIHLRAVLRSCKIRPDWSDLRIPADALKRPYRVLSDADVRSMIRSVTDPVLRDALIVVAGTGVRRSELARIQAGDVIVDGLIVRELKRSRGRGFTVRTVPMSKAVRQALQRRIKATDDALIFPHVGLLGQRLQAALKGTRFKGRGWHDLRKRAASKMLANGIPIPAAASLLGHSAEVMLKVYAKPYENDMTRAVELL